MNYFKDRFPLQGTSTVYMSGQQEYFLTRPDRGGLIASVALEPWQAELFREAVRKFAADAWDEGFTSTENKNPYREELLKDEVVVEPNTNRGVSLTKNSATGSTIIGMPYKKEDV